MDLQLSNGTTIRYPQLFEDIIKSNNYCNRGVAGIDGSTSTALGASMARGSKTLLITGDMSFSYDLGGLACQYKNKNFKIIVISNNGGGIFRFIKGPSDLPELEQYFEVNKEVNIKGIAEAFEYKYFEAVDCKSLESVFDKFISDDNTAILAIKTPNITNAEVLRGYFRRNRK